jgi:hypothetical protein
MSTSAELLSRSTASAILILRSQFHFQVMVFEASQSLNSKNSLPDQNLFIDTMVTQ